jgi:hypothetical protein
MLNRNLEHGIDVATGFNVYPKTYFSECSNKLKKTSKIESDFDLSV